MQLKPAIDILGGKAVRLAQGDYTKVTVYNDDPVEQARTFASQGASWLHVVDLDGARDGRPVNADAIERIVRETEMSVEVGGGIRTLDVIERYVSAGAARIVVGTALVRDPDMAARAAERFGDKIAAGVDAKGGQVAVEGWREGSGIAATELVGRLASLGIRHLIYTDIARDGMQTGIDVDAYAAIATASGVGVTASGGISTIDDLIALARAAAGLAGPGTIEGAITGRAVYEGAFTVADAISAIERAEKGE